ncbi:right-handed parallel beta-helix repeat-containing protein [Pricia sp. S334]|uniref:Right-handed parallel beta-helix repeat-containing protein n=1 Tax=Pricia mediterranea TaxID=3076079 RepID=A0ABU3L8X9_9FLAO|nr:right-handed parallel beta-helix repeat-containing protein [Pricia sp. S334]MDT7830204.1 right-handed parallel beta-helix repeat-containing protein [Pricia sp. S334]
MKISNSKIVQSMVSLYVLVLLLSCSKDSDLLADYMLSNVEEARLRADLAIDDNFLIGNQKSIVLNVLANDKFNDPDKVKITKISQPSNGNVVIHNDKTLIYYPNPEDSEDRDNATGGENQQSTAEEKKNEEATDPNFQSDSQETVPEHSTETPEAEETEPANLKEEETKPESPTNSAEEASPEAASEVSEMEVTQQTSLEKEEFKEPTPTAAVEETSQDTFQETKEENELKSKKDDQKKPVSEDFTYTVEITDDENKKTEQKATVTITQESTNEGGKDKVQNVPAYDYPPDAVYASSFGFQAGDATEAFKAAINSGSRYVVIDKQSSDWVIRTTRFFDLENMTIVFEPGVTLRAKSGAFLEGNRLFKLTRAKNVTIEGTGATFKMNKEEYTSGEQRHALEIDKCSDITVRGLTIRGSGGAGIVITGDRNTAYSQNITVENVKSFNNRRDGITIVSAQNVWVRNSEFSGSSGTKPEAGVVLEADSPGERLVNINFTNCKFSGNNSAGIHFSTARMDSGTRPVSINIVDCEFSNNAVSPFRAVPATEIYIGGGKGPNAVGGEIRFERNHFNGSPGRILFTRKAANGFKVIFKDCLARNVVSSTTAAPISLEANGDRNTVGGISFSNFYIEYNQNVPFMHINAPSRGGTFNVKDVSGSFTIKEPNNGPLKYSGGYQPDKNINVSINYKHI